MFHKMRWLIERTEYKDYDPEQYPAAAPWPYVMLPVWFAMVASGLALHDRSHSWGITVTVLGGILWLVTLAGWDWGVEKHTDTKEGNPVRI